MRLLICVLLSVAVMAKERVLLGAHFKQLIPMFPTMSAVSKTLAMPQKDHGQVFALCNSWYFASHQPAAKVAEFYAERWPDANRSAVAANHILFTLRPDGARKLKLPGGQAAYEWIEVEIAEMSALNEVLKPGERGARTSIHISEFVAP